MEAVRGDCTCSKLGVKDNVGLKASAELGEGVETGHATKLAVLTKIQLCVYLF